MQPTNSQRKRAKMSKSSQQSTVVDHQMPVDLSSVRVDSDVLKDMRVKVVRDTYTVSEAHTGATLGASREGDYNRGTKPHEELSKALKRHGAEIVYGNVKEGDNVHVVVGDESTIRAKNCVKNAKHDVFSWQYLIRCINQGKVSKPLFSDYVRMSAATLESFGDTIDEFGDSYTEFATMASLKRSMARVDKPLPVDRFVFLDADPMEDPLRLDCILSISVDA